MASSNPYKGGHTNVYRTGIGTGQGKRNSATSEPSGKTARPRGGKSVAIRSSGTSTMSVKSGTSGYATVPAKKR